MITMSINEFLDEVENMTDEEYVQSVDWRHNVDKLREENAALKKRVEQAESRLERLREAVEEVMDGTLPYLAEKRLREALDEVNKV